MKDRQLYCCSSYYQLLVSLMKILYHQQQADLLLEVHGIETAKILAERITKLLKEHGTRALVCPDDPQLDPYTQRLCSFLPHQRRRLKRYMDQILEGIDPAEEYGQIHVFWDLGYSGTYFNIRGIHYRLHEDSLDSCCRIRENRPNYTYIFRPFSPKFLLKKYLGAGVIPFGFSPCCSVIEVNALQGLQIPRDKVEVYPRKQLMESLTEEQKNVILQVFTGSGTELPSFSGEEVLLLTEPFAASGRLPGESVQIRMYEEIVREYTGGRPLIIKAHPRDCVDYRSVFPDARIIEKNLPMELLNFYEGCGPFLAVTVTSSAIFSISGNQEKISLGADYLRHFQ